MQLHTLVRNAGLAGLVVALAAPLLARAPQADETNRVEAATRVFHEIEAVPDRAIPDAVLRDAHCIAVIPGEKKFALGFGGTYGKGVVSCRQGNGAWGAPMFISLAGGSWGAQIGGESSDIVMVFRSEHGLDSMLTSKFRIGAGASAAAGPVGREADAATDVKLNAEILTYARSRGAFAGIDLNGAVVQPDRDANRAAYHSEDSDQIVHGTTAAPAFAQGFVQELNRFSTHEAH